MLDLYLITGVSPEEYKSLKSKEAEIVDECKTSFNEEWRPRIKDIKVSFKYNPALSAIGIFVERENEQILAERSSIVFGNHQELSINEGNMALSLRVDLEERLRRIRIQTHQDWVD